MGDNPVVTTDDVSPPLASYGDSLVFTSDGLIPYLTKHCFVK
jgi:hypothetical protein